MAVDINEVEYSDWLVSKINSRKQCTIDDVFDALENRESASWDDDEQRGRRLFVRGRDHTGRILRVILFPVNEEEGIFRLVTVLY